MQLAMQGAAAPGATISSKVQRRAGLPVQRPFQHIRPARAVAVQASDSQGLFSSKSSLLGPAAPSQSGLSSLSGPGASTAKASNLPSLDDVPLESGLGVDYTQLRDLLKAGDWRAAEDEQRAKLIEAAGPGAQKRGWVYFTEVEAIPAEDMRTMDLLWRAASNGRYGYSVQRELWLQNRRMWTKFFQAIDWVQGENNVYRKWPQEFFYKEDAPKGHLPLTNALRGTRLFEAIMEHPAIAEQLSSSKGAAKPDWLK